MASGTQHTGMPVMQDIITAQAVCPKQATVVNPELSIVIPVFNRGSLVRETLAAILGQPNVSFEIVLANDGSTDDSIEAILSFNDPRLTVLDLDGNHGASIARNTAIAVGARADWICPFDSDDLMLPNALAPYFRYVTQKPQAQWGYGMLKISSDNPAHNGCVMGQPFDLLRFLQRNTTCHGMSLYRRDSFLEAGGYDPTLAVGEDYDLFLRYLERSDPVHYPHVNFIYRRHGDNISTSQLTDQANEAVFNKLRTRLTQSVFSTGAFEHVERLKHGFFLLDAFNNQHWEALLQHAEWLLSHNAQSFELDRYMALALAALGRRQDALAISLGWLQKLADGTRLLAPELEWIVVFSLDLARQLQRPDVLTAILPLATCIAQTTASAELRTVVNHLESALVTNPESPDYLKVCRKRVGNIENKGVPTRGGSAIVGMRTKRAVLHFVYSGNPLSDASIRAPETITNHLYREFERDFSVNYLEWTERRMPAIGEKDIILGHPHYDQHTVIQRVFREASTPNKFLIFPFHHALPGSNMPFDPLVRQCRRLFSITGEYWYDTLKRSPFAHWSEKMIRVDMAVDVTRFPFLKRKFNPPGLRTFFYMGTDAPEKGQCELADLVRHTSIHLIHAGWVRQSQKYFDGLPVTFLGIIDLTPERMQWIANKCDFFVNMSVSDANPTTILEMAALGLPVLCTPESGYTRSDLVYSLRLDDMAHNIAVINALQQADEEGLRKRVKNVRATVEAEYTWQRFCRTVREGLEQFL